MAHPAKILGGPGRARSIHAPSSLSCAVVVAIRAPLHYTVCL